MKPNVMSDEYWVYMLETGNGFLYTGCSTDPERRFQQHLKGRGAKFTRANPVKRIVVKWGGMKGRGEAQRVEAFIKKQPRSRKKQYVENPGLLLNDYSAHFGENPGFVPEAAG